MFTELPWPPENHVTAENTSWYLRLAQAHGAWPQFRGMGLGQKMCLFFSPQRNMFTLLDLQCKHYFIVSLFYLTYPTFLCP